MLVNRCLDAGMKPTYDLAVRAQKQGHFEIATQFVVYLRGQRGILPSGELELLHPLLFKIRLEPAFQSAGSFML